MQMILFLRSCSRRQNAKLMFLSLPRFSKYKYLGLGILSSVKDDRVVVFIDIEFLLKMGIFGDFKGVFTLFGLYVLACGITTVGQILWRIRANLSHPPSRNVVADSRIAGLIVASCSADMNSFLWTAMASIPRERGIPGPMCLFSVFLPERVLYCCQSQTQL